MPGAMEAANKSKLLRTPKIVCKSVSKMLEKAPIIFMIPQIIFCEVLIFRDDTQEAMFTYTQTVMSQGEIYNTFSVKNLTPHVLAQEISKRT